MALGVMTACQSDSDFDSNDYLNDPRAVKVNASIGSLSSRANSHESGDKWAYNDKIHIRNTSPGAIVGKNAAEYRYDGNKWNPGDSYIVWTEGENSFEAYYPCDLGTNATHDSFELPANQSTPANLAQADWMTAETATMQTADNSISLNFRHRLARVTVKIKGYNSQYGTTLPRIGNPHFYFPDVDTDKAVTQSIYFDYVKGCIIKDVDGGGLHSFMVILPAGKYSSESTLMTLNVDGQTLKVKPTSYLVTTGLEAGNAYTVNLTVGKNTASISGITVLEWYEGWNENGTATVLPPKVEGNTVTLEYPGQLTAAALDEATADGNHSLTIAGDMSTGDFRILRTWFAEKSAENPSARYTLELPDVAELPAATSFIAKDGALNASPIAILKAPNLSVIGEHSLEGCNIDKELWFTKAGAIGYNYPGPSVFNSDYNISSNIKLYLNIDKKPGGAGSPSVWEKTINSKEWIYWGTSEEGDYIMLLKTCIRFVDEAGNITDWDGNAAD